jgi:hypothetical protein
MINAEASAAAAKRLETAAEKLLILDDGTGGVNVATDKLIISFNRVGLRIGNITSETTTLKNADCFRRNSVWDLRRPPVDSPDIAELNRMAGILESYLESI